MTLAAGRYRFTATTDDGSRLWIDDQLTIDAWGVDGLTTHTVDLDLAAGDHALRFQSVEHTGGATAQLTWVLRTPVVLASGESLGENQTRVSLDGAYRLQYQGDGNLVVVRLANDSCAWSSQTNNTSVGATVMQGDGNLVIYNGDWTGIWSTGTWGHDGARLEIANDTMAIVAPGETTLWSVSLAAAPNAWSSAAMGTLPGASSGPAGRAAGVLLGVIALIGFVASVVRRRRWFAVEPRAGHRRSGFGGQAAGWRPHGARRLRVQPSATGLLLTAMLLVPASALAQIPTQVVEYYHTDALGSVRAVTKQVNGQWQVVARHDFMPFGEEVAPPSPAQDKRLFTGKERDNETALDYFEARYLRASTGRFTTIDPVYTWQENLEDPQRWNRYSYALANPLAYIDPDGRTPITVAGGEFGKRLAGARAEYQEATGLAKLWAGVKYALVASEIMPGTSAVAVETRAVAVYQALRADGTVEYVGITSDLARRAAQHARGAGYDIAAIEGLDNLTRMESRAVEQVLIEFHGLGKNGGTLANRINSIAKTNRDYADWLAWGKRLLENLGIPIQ